MIQQDYPVYANDTWLLDNVKDDLKDRALSRMPQTTDPRLNLNGNVRYFDALSFYIQLHKNERSRIFGFDKPKTHEMRQVFHERLKGHAAFIVEQYSIETAQLYQFIFFLLDLRSDYQRNERNKLADEVERDLMFAIELVCLATNQTIQDVAEEAGRQTSFPVKREIRALNQHLEMRDYTQETFEQVMSGYNELLPEFQISREEIEKLLEFTDSTGKLLIPYTIFETDKALNSKEPIHKLVLYSAVKNLTTGLEVLLRELAKRRNPNGSWGSLEDLIAELFSEWYPLFQSERKKRQPTPPSSPSEFIKQIIDVSADAGLGNETDGRVVRIFLISYWSRNLTGHYETLEDDFYGELRGHIITAIYYSYLYSWKKMQSFV